MARHRKSKARRRAISLAGGETAPNPPRGRDRRHVNQPRQPRDDAHLPAMEARVRQIGIEGGDAIQEAARPWYGCSAGRAMASVTEPAERPRLWDAIQHARRVQVAYDKAIGAPKRHATCLRLLSPRDRMETAADTPPIDMRDDDTRYRQAVSAWMRLHGALGYCDKADVSVFVSTVLDDAECRDAQALLRVVRMVADRCA